MAKHFNGKIFKETTESNWLLRQKYIPGLDTNTPIQNYPLLEDEDVGKIN